MATKLFVGGTPDDADEIQNLFNQHGNAVSVDMVYDPNTLRSRGFCFVWIDGNEADVEYVIEALNGKFWQGRRLKVSIARNQD